MEPTIVHAAVHLGAHPLRTVLLFAHTFAAPVVARKKHLQLIHVQNDDSPRNQEPEAVVLRRVLDEMAKAISHPSVSCEWSAAMATAHAHLKAGISSLEPGSLQRTLPQAPPPG